MAVGLDYCTLWEISGSNGILHLTNPEVELVDVDAVKTPIRGLSRVSSIKSIDVDIHELGEQEIRLAEERIEHLKTLKEKMDRDVAARDAAKVLLDASHSDAALAAAESDLKMEMERTRMLELERDKEQLEKQVKVLAEERQQFEEEAARLVLNQRNLEEAESKKKKLQKFSNSKMLVHEEAERQKLEKLKDSVARKREQELERRLKEAEERLAKNETERRLELEHVIQSLDRKECDRLKQLDRMQNELTEQKRLSIGQKNEIQSLEREKKSLEEQLEDQSTQEAEQASIEDELVQFRAKVEFLSNAEDRLRNDLESERLSFGMRNEQLEQLENEKLILVESLAIKEAESERYESLLKNAQNESLRQKEELKTALAEKELKSEQCEKLLTFVDMGEKLKNTLLEKEAESKALRARLDAAELGNAEQQEKVKAAISEKEIKVSEKEIETKALLKRLNRVEEALATKEAESERYETLLNEAKESKRNELELQSLVNEKNAEAERLRIDMGRYLEEQNRGKEAQKKLKAELEFERRSSLLLAKEKENLEMEKQRSSLMQSPQQGTSASSGKWAFGLGMLVLAGAGLFVALNSKEK